MQRSLLVFLFISLVILTHAQVKVGATPTGKHARTSQLQINKSLIRNEVSIPSKWERAALVGVGR